jgi:hypothetical protein
VPVAILARHRRDAEGARVHRTRHLLAVLRPGGPRRAGRDDVRRLRGPHPGPILPPGGGQAVARRLPQVLRVQASAGHRADLLRPRREHLLQGRLLSVSPFYAPQ